MKFNLFILITFSFSYLFAQKKADVNTIQDIDGNSYTIMRTDSTEWFLENLKTTRFTNGDTIPTTKSSHSALPIDSTQVYKWAPAGDKERIKKQGYLYNWNAVIDKRGLCPTGWKVPTDAEWKTWVDKIYNETNSYSMIENENPSFIYKKIDQTQKIPDAGKMEYAGARMINGNYIFHETFAYYWTSSLDYKGFAWMWYFSTTNINHFNFELNGGLSVRCMRQIGDK